MSKIMFDPMDLKGMIQLMKTHGDSSTMYPGVNEIGETVYISIFPERIVVSTMQKNSWVRINTYHKDGSREEIFDGKWE